MATARLDRRGLYRKGAQSLKPMKVLVLSRSYPNSVTELLGLWAEQLVRDSTRFCEPKVVSPVPYCPPLPGPLRAYTRFRRIESRCRHNGIEVFHPRFLAGPGYSLYNFEAALYAAGIRKCVADLRRNFDFDLIHAHFTYPDGVVAIELGRLYNVPVIVTEHIPWDVWAAKYPKVRERAAQAALRCAYHVSVSESVRRTVEESTGQKDNFVVVPNGVDGSLFTAGENGQKRSRNQILFAGAVRPIKGVDVLLRAVRLLVNQGVDANLLVVGEAYYGSYRKEETRLRQLALELDLETKVRFAGKKSPADLAADMRESAVLVLPSRAESFGMVLVEALASGTPVVATRCGGPEDIVNDQVGVLVPKEDPEALAKGIRHVLEHTEEYPPAKLRAHALEKFGLEPVGNRMARLYEQSVENFQSSGAAISRAQGGSLAN
ncbi:MAG TPA: glycosyltransferase [Bryobacteraceae bacterium]|jgi:glycosyltransferase involved in cell wall biosynthesis